MILYQVFDKIVMATQLQKLLINTVLSKAGYSIAYTDVAPGASIEPYWMDDADETIFVIEGDNIEVVHSFNSNICCIDSFEFKEGFFALNEIGSTWTLTNNGNHAAKVLRVYNSNIPSMISPCDAIETLPEDIINSMVYENRFRFRSYLVTSKMGLLS
jgi:uncharacterized cupin superfamily protein